MGLTSTSNSNAGFLNNAYGDVNICMTEWEVKLVVPGKRKYELPYA